jgi:hypothetical protein
MLRPGRAVRSRARKSRQAKSIARGRTRAATIVVRIHRLLPVRRTILASVRPWACYLAYCLSSARADGYYRFGRGTTDGSSLLRLILCPRAEGQFARQAPVSDCQSTSRRRDGDAGPCMSRHCTTDRTYREQSQYTQAQFSNAIISYIHNEAVIRKLCHSGTRAERANPEPMNTRQCEVGWGLCSWVPACAGMTKEDGVGCPVQRWSGDTAERERPRSEAGTGASFSHERRRSGLRHRPHRAPLGDGRRFRRL